MINIENTTTSAIPNILIIGVGGAGNNAINRMNGLAEGRARFLAVNTDNQALSDAVADMKLQIGVRQTGGYGAGADPRIGELSAQESEEEIRTIVKEADMVILTCGMGGGTGTGATPVIAAICKEEGVLTIGIVTLPFTFESGPRHRAAEVGIQKLKPLVDTLLIISNDKLLTMTDRKFKVSEAFVAADEVLHYGIEGITNIIYNKGVVNLDFNDLRTTLADKGVGHLGIGRVRDGGTLLDAVKEAVHSPMLDTDISGATNLLINSSGDVDLLELNEAICFVRELAGSDVDIIWGTVTDENNPEEIVITLIATGMKEPVATPVQPKPLPKVTHREQPRTVIREKKIVPEPEVKILEIPQFLRDITPRDKRTVPTV